MIIAFDLSTTVCGYTVYDNINNKEIELSFHKFKEEELLDRGKELEALVERLHTKYPDLTDFAVEARLKAFAAKRSNAEALFNTAQMNFLGQFLWMKKGVNVHQINVQTARKLAYPTFHKVARTLDIDNKEYAFELVRHELGEDIFPKKTMKSGPNKGQIRFVDEAMDMADSFIICKALYHILKDKK